MSNRKAVSLQTSSNLRKHQSVINVIGTLHALISSCSFSLSWEVNSRSDSHTFPKLLYGTRRLITVLIRAYQLNPVKVHTSYYIKIHFNITLHPDLGLVNCVLSSILSITVLRDTKRQFNITSSHWSLHNSIYICISIQLFFYKKTNPCHIQE